MLNSLFFLLSLTLILWTDSSPIDLSFLGLDNLDKDIADLKYPSEESSDESNEGTLDDFFKSTEKKSSKKDDKEEDDSDKSKNKVNASGSKKKKTEGKGINFKYNIDDLKKFLKQVGFHDAGSFDDGTIFGLVKGLFSKGVGIVGKEEIKYKKGQKSKGFHKVSHKDEYNKENEFFEDDETSGVIKKVGAKGIAIGKKAGGGIQKGYFHHDHDKGLFGKQAASDEGNLNKEYEGYADSQEIDAFFKSSKE